jgi:hypothetical protein
MEKSNSCSPSGVSTPQATVHYCPFIINEHKTREDIVFISKLKALRRGMFKVI